MKQTLRALVLLTYDKEHVYYKALIRLFIEYSLVVANVVDIWPNLPLAEKLSIFLRKKTVALHLFKGPVYGLQLRYRDGEIKRTYNTHSRKNYSPNAFLWIIQRRDLDK